jgi:hypothetical protein
VANARFLEILRCYGVDETAEPHPGMIIPQGGENQVVLETAGLDLTLQSGVLKTSEYDGALARDLLLYVKEDLSKPGVDPQERDANMPFLGWQKPRFFRILGSHATGFPGILVQAVSRSNGRRGASSAAGAKLYVAVVDRQTIYVAIRNVKARDANGQFQYHAKQPCNPDREVAQMNAIWTPQTNIKFELVKSEDVIVDDTDPATQKELSEAYGMKTVGTATFRAGGTVWSEKNSPWFAKHHKVKGAHITFFFVHKLHSGGDPVYGKGGRSPQGTMNREFGVSFIAADRLRSTFAHEAGHYVGDMEHEGQGIELLMRGDGSGYKIPFKMAERFRKFVAKHPKP